MATILLDYDSVLLRGWHVYTYARRYRRRKGPETLLMQLADENISDVTSNHVFSCTVVDFCSPQET